MQAIDYFFPYLFFFVITLVYNFLGQCVEKCTWTGLAAFAGKMFLNKLCYSFKVKILWQRRSFKKWNKNLKRKFKCWYKNRYSVEIKLGLGLKWEGTAR